MAPFAAVGPTMQENAGRAAKLWLTMLHATSVSQPTSPSGTDSASTPIAGGEAWVMPFELGAPAWITVGAPQIRVIDRRAAKRQALVAAGR